MPYGHPESDYEFFDAFVKQHLGEFGKFAFYIVRDYDCAQDGIQNALEAIMKYYDRVRDFDEQRLYRYCLAIIKHECIRVATGNRNVISTEEIEHFDSVPDEMLDNIIRANNNAILKECITQLPEKFKLAILMKYYYNQSDREIAQAIGVSDASVRMILTRARQKLKKRYMELTGEEVPV